MGPCRIGTSCAMRSRPRGSIHKPRTGKMLNTPPTISNTATDRRAQNEDGVRSHRMNPDSLGGIRRSIALRYLLSSSAGAISTDFFRMEQTHFWARFCGTNAHVVKKSKKRTATKNTGRGMKRAKPSAAQPEWFKGQFQGVPWPHSVGVMSRLPENLVATSAPHSEADIRVAFAQVRKGPEAGLRWFDLTAWGRGRLPQVLRQLRPVNNPSPPRAGGALRYIKDGRVSRSGLDTVETFPSREDLDMTSPVVKRSIVIGGHKTSISIEDAFWNCMKEISGESGKTLSELVSEIDSSRRQGNRSSAVRLFVLDYFRTTAPSVRS
jgi:predicted DNA-binding ribbon-helix-helix protein